MKRETYEKIICFLASRQEATQYEIAQDKEVDLSYAPVHQAIEELLFKNLIEETRTESGQGALPKRYFKLSFSGFITALATFSSHDNAAEGVDPKVRNSLREPILAQRKFYPEVKIFAEWEFLEKIFDDPKSKDPCSRDQIYAYLGLAARDWLREFGDFKSANLQFFKLNNEWKAELRKTYLGIIGTNRMQRRFTELFLKSLVDYIRNDGALENVKEATPNKALYDYVAAFFEDERQRKLAKIAKMEQAKELLLKQFATATGK
jgi:DNA-binding PadR family transcriptional regulator